MTNHPTGDTRSQILAAAAELFIRQGYAGTSVREIAKRLGISNPSLYHHFASKEALFVELLTAPMEVVESAVAQAASLRGEARARRIIDGLIDAMLVHGGFVIAAARDADQISDPVRRDIIAAMQPYVVSLLSGTAARDRRALRVTMAVAAVQGAVMELLRTVDGDGDPATRLAKRRGDIVDLAIVLLRK